MNAPLSTHPTPPYKHTPLFPLGKDTTPYRKIAADGLRVERVLGEEQRGVLVGRRRVGGEGCVHGRCLMFMRATYTPFLCVIRGLRGHS